MKKEELFELLGQVDDKYIEDAMCDEFDSLRPVEVRAGKTKITPIKIIAPIAACLAVFVAAGFIVSFALKDNMKTMPGDTSAVDSLPQDSYDFTPDEKEFIEQCNSIVLEKNKLTEQDVKSWQARKLDIDFDGKEEFLIYPVFYRYYDNSIGVSVFGRSDDEPRNLGSFYLNNYGATLDNIFEYSKDGSEAYYFYTSYDDYSLSVDGRYIEGVQRLYLNTVENNVETETELQVIREWGPTDAVISTKYCYFDLAVPETEFYAYWFAFPNAPSINSISADDFYACRNAILQEHSELDTEKFLLKSITAASYYDNTKISRFLLVGTQNESVPIYAFQMTDNGVVPAGTIDSQDGLPVRLDNIQPIDKHLYPDLYYYISKTVTEFGDEKISIEECSVNRIFTSDGKIDVQKYLSFGRDINDKVKIYYYRRYGEDITPDVFIKEWKRFDTSDIENLP